LPIPLKNPLRNGKNQVNEENAIKPWEMPTIYGDFPGGSCCKESPFGVCREHDKSNYKWENNRWILNDRND